MKACLMTFLAAGFAFQAQAAPIDLGPATGYNVFVQQNFTQPGADSQGKIAVGGNANIGQYDVGVNYDSSYGGSGIPFWKQVNGTSNVLVVGGNLTTTGWGNIKGNATVGGTVIDASGHSAKGTITQGAPIDFNSAFSYLNNLSTNLAAVSANSLVDFKYGNWLNLSATGSLAGNDVMVANITGSMLKAATDLSAPQLGANNTLVVNVSGKNIHFDSLNYGARENVGKLGLTSSHILYNFFEAEDITFDYGGFFGNILAPKANFTFQSGDLSGQVIAKSWVGNWGAQANLWDGYFVPPVVVPPPPPLPPPPVVTVAEPSALFTLLIGVFGILAVRRRRI